MESLVPNFERAPTLSRVLLGKRRVCRSNVVVLYNTLRVHGFALFYQGRADAHGVFGSLAWWLTRARRVALATPVQHEPFSTTTTIPARGADPRDVHSIPALPESYHQRCASSPCRPKQPMGLTGSGSTHPDAWRALHVTAKH
jgi:hypothetical protein